MTSLSVDTKLFRIFNFHDFINSLETNTIWLGQASRMEDRNELFGIYFDLFGSEFGPMFEEQIAKTQQAFRKAQTHHYMTCWTRTQSNIALWSLYSPSRDAIQVCTTFGSIKLALDKHFKKYPFALAYKLPANNPTDLFMPPTYGDVDYVDFENRYSDLKNKCVRYFSERDAWFDEHCKSRLEEFAAGWVTKSKLIRERVFGKERHGGPLLKDHRYQHEREVRFILALKRRDGRSEEEYRKHPMAGLDDPSRHPEPEACPANIFIPFDQGNFLGIEADGRMDDWKFQAIKRILAKYGKDINKSDAFSQLNVGES